MTQIMDEPELGADTLRRVWGNFATGVAILTGHDGNEPIGFTCQSVVSVSLDPPLMSFCPAKTSTTWPRLRSLGRFCVNILAEDQIDLCRQFARSGVDKFASVDWTPTAVGVPALRGAVAHIDARLTAEHDAGDHTVVLAEVTSLTADETTRPLLFFRGAFGQLAG